MKRRVFTILLAMVMALAYSVPILNMESQVFAATSKTPDEAIAWVKSKLGTSIDMDGAPADQPYQCVDLIKAYYSYLGVSPVIGDGKDYATNDLPSGCGWTRVQGGTPQKGDILVYGPFTGYLPNGEWFDNPYGHVAIYESEYSTYHQNYSGPYVQNVTNVRYDGFYNPYWGYIRPFNSFTSKIEEVKGVEGGIYLKGWTFNNNNVTKCTQIHVYLDGPVGSGSQGWAVPADKSRKDVDNAYHVGEFHGFEQKIEGITAGNHTVYLYANDQYLNESAYIGAYNVTVTGAINGADSPTFSDFHVGELREGAFTVMAKVTDPDGIKEVKYAIWTDNDGQDDIVWYPGYCTDNNDYYWARVNFSEHNYERNIYTIHMYAYDNKDNLTNVGISYYFKETGPTISNVVVSDVTASGYTVTCTVKDNLGVLRVQFPTWTEKNGQDDIASDWNINTKVRGTKSGDAYSFRVNASEHNNETGNYNTHIYAYDQIGNATSYAVPTVKVHNHSFDAGVITKAATCTEAGMREKTCTECGYKVTESIDATGHKWNTAYTVDVPATESAAGSQSIHCSVCGAIKEGSSQVIPQLTPSTPDGPTPEPEPTPTPTPTPAPSVTPAPQAPAEIQDLPAVKMSKPAAAKKSVNVKWKKVSKKNQKKIQGIEIQVATDPDFTNLVKTATAGKKKTSKKIKGLTSKQTYYVRIRAYKDAADGKHVSAWKAKKVKIK